MTTTNEAGENFQEHERESDCCAGWRRQQSNSRGSLAT